MLAEFPCLETTSPDRGCLLPAGLPGRGPGCPEGLDLLLPVVRKPGARRRLGALDRSPERRTPNRRRASTRPAACTRARAERSSRPRCARSPPPASRRWSLVVGLGIAGGPAAAARDPGGARRRARGRRPSRAVPRPNDRSIEADILHLQALGITRFYVYRPFDLAVADWAAAPRRDRTGSSSSRRPRSPAKPAAAGSTASTRTTSSCSAGTCSRGSAPRPTASASSACRRSGRATTPRRATATSRVSRAATARPTTRCGRRPSIERRRRDDHELQRVARGDADRAGAPAAGGRPQRRPTRLRRRVRARGQGAENAYLDRTKFWSQQFLAARGSLALRERSGAKTSAAQPKTSAPSTSLRSTPRRATGGRGRLTTSGQASEPERGRALVRAEAEQ